MEFLRREMWRLQNLVNSQDALDARSFDKFGLDDLEMKWSANLKDDLRKTEAEKKVLSLLQPHKKLKKLTIKCYVTKLTLQPLAAAPIQTMSPAAAVRNQQKV
ncbi:hypothetical protein QQP08_004633 [Theobroma cacao]|nr:hypothetical protein QQP08_004633 [Theobroma cacao]